MMAPEPVAAERAYQLLKKDIICGRFMPGSTVIERVMAGEYGVSVSPLRDGAQRLVGEGMLEIAGGGGYCVPPMPAEALHDLYAWHSHLIRLVIKSALLKLGSSAPVDPLPTGASDTDVAEAATELFHVFARSVGNLEFARALHAANDRLHPVRLREGRVLTNLAGELSAVMMTTVHGSGPDRFEVLWAYHRRRLRRVNRIAVALLMA
ncbi:GntR family transcriptional regulator [Novosphingobium sediminicola]|uniref:DNA-binding GntR family transcriptional regulator n=1 Tax=Novosphingobium sediminicola TaxID=563162 RepID=A0A7W6CNM5_9SPHN|nr:GntR family transcriptional regulator [Novosphingobium sediminicola]MBB3957080.1 DNA-binding GntR family transcriptional regulator [Novosphingobium sediminicola]